MITYGGVPLAAISESLAAQVEGELEYARLPEFWASHAAWHLQTGRSQWAWRGDPGMRLPPVVLGRLSWPTGASQFAVAHMLATDTQLASIRTLAYDGGAAGKFKSLALVMHDGKYGITTKMWMLPPRPLAQGVQGRELNLLSLVDDRYFWWQDASDEILVPSEAATWAALIAAIGTALGVTIALNPTTIPAAYLTPTSDFSCRYDYLPPLLDAACASVGRKLIRKLDGTLTAQSPAQALALQEQQVAKWPRHAGGVLAFKP